MRIGRTLPDPKNPDSIVEYLSRTERIIDGGIEFGYPSDPKDPASTTKADGAAHNGTILNITGSWVEVLLTSTGRSTITCTHNLGTQVISGRANVRWLVFGLFHDGTGATGATEFSINLFYVGGTTTTNAIDLVAVPNLSAGPLTINASHPLGITLFFVPAIR